MTKWYWPFGSLVNKWNSTYDNNGNNIKSSWYNFDGCIVDKWISRYDDNGNVIESSSYKPDGSLVEKRLCTYEFDDEGNWLKKAVYIDDSPSFIIDREIEYFN